MHGVDLNAVDAGLAQELRGLAEGLDALLYLLNGERLGLVVLLPAVRSIEAEAQRYSASMTGLASLPIIGDRGTDRSYR